MEKKYLWGSSHKKQIDFLFPPLIGSKTSSKLFNFGLQTLRKVFKNSSEPWIPKSPDNNTKIPNKIPDDGMHPNDVISETIKKFLPGAPNWRSPELQYNICAPVNAVAQTLLSLGQEINIHNISTDFAGNCLLAEKVISEMMADLIDRPKDKVRALFSFGGTASNMYAMKIAINKSVPNAGKIGVPSNLHVMITANAHFSHKTAGDWLGIGIDHLVQIKNDEESRSIIEDAEIKARSIIEKGGVIVGFQINGGPFYDFAIDDIDAFVDLRDRLVKECNLSFSPHIHVDSVIGWIWLMFNGYDFELNPLKIPTEILPIIKEQFKRIYQVRKADSWGVDFHKGLGGCPTPCGLFVSNNRNDLLLLSKKERGIDTHHLGNDWSLEDPSDITLETSRSAGEALSAVGSLLVMGKNGFRRLLANQIFCTKVFRDLISEEEYFIVGNPHALGFNTMVLLSPGNKKANWKEFLLSVSEDDELLDRLNEEVKSFYEFCLKSDSGDISRLGCSFSKGFYKTKSGKAVSGLKYCFVSPHTNSEHIKNEVDKLKSQLISFRALKNK